MGARQSQTIQQRRNGIVFSAMHQTMTRQNRVNDQILCMFRSFPVAFSKLATILGLQKMWFSEFSRSSAKSDKLIFQFLILIVQRSTLALMLGLIQIPYYSMSLFNT